MTAPWAVAPRNVDTRNIIATSRLVLYTHQSIKIPWAAPIAHKMRPNCAPATAGDEYRSTSTDLRNATKASASRAACTNGELQPTHSQHTAHVRGETQCSLANSSNAQHYVCICASTHMKGMYTPMRMSLIGRNTTLVFNSRLLRAAKLVHDRAMWAKTLTPIPANPATSMA